MTNYTGTLGDDSFTGTSGADAFHMEDGGSDTVQGGGGADLIYFGAFLDATDQINGQGTATVFLAGDYSAGLDVANTTMKGVATLNLASGFTYDLRFGNGVVAAGQTMDIFAPGGSTIDASADKIGGNYSVLFGRGSSTFLGGAGVDIVSILASQDIKQDHLVGGDGLDELYLRHGNYNLTNGQVQDFDLYHLVEGGKYKFKVSDAVVGSGDTLHVEPGDGTSLRFDGHLETDGAFYFGLTTSFGKGGPSKLIGGANADYFAFSGADTIEGGGGADMIYAGSIIIYRTIWDSTPAAADKLFLSQYERIDLHRIDADTTTRGNQAFHLVSTFSHAPGEITIRDTGTYDGVRHADILGDVNGDGSADFEIHVSDGISDFNLLTYNNFIY